MKQRSYLNLIYASFDRGTVALFGFISIIYFARVLTKSEFGLFVLAKGIFTLSITLCDVAIGQALIHYGAGETKKDLWDYAVNSLTLKLIVFGCLSILLLFLSPLLSLIFHVNLSGVIKVLILLIFITIIYSTPLQIFTAKEKFKSILAIDSSHLIFLILGIVISSQYGFLNSAQAAIIFLFLIRLIPSILGILKLKTFVASKPIIHPEKIKRIFKYAKSSFANALGVFTFSKTDIFMLGYMLTPIHVAAYSSAAVTMDLFRVINEPVNMVIFPKISKLKNESQSTRNIKIRHIYYKAAAFSFILCAMVSIILLIFPSEIMSLIYGNKYLESAHLLRLFGIWGLLLPFSRIAGSTFNGIGRPDINAKFTWTSAIMNIGLNIILISYLQTTGAALATVLTAVFLLTLVMIKLQQLFKIFAFTTNTP